MSNDTKKPEDERPTVPVPPMSNEELSRQWEQKLRQGMPS